jgi:hypothetical protein
VKRPRSEGEGGSSSSAPPPPLVDPDADALFKGQLSEEKRVKVYAYKGVGAFCDIREMYEKEGLTWKLPGKKGITLNFAQVQALFEHKDAILEAMEKGQRSEAGGRKKGEDSKKKVKEEEEEEEEEGGGGGKGKKVEEKEEEEEEDSDDDDSEDSDESDD